MNHNSILLIHISSHFSNSSLIKQCWSSSAGENRCMSVDDVNECLMFVCSLKEITVNVKCVWSTRVILQYTDGDL